jgi:apolipoprotein N-acyltransferase
MRSECVLAVGLGMLCGALGILGYPGIGLWPVYIVALAVLAYNVRYQASLAFRVAFTLGFLLGQYPAAFLGTLSWGYLVPWASALAAAAVLAVPVVLLAAIGRKLDLGPLHTAVASICLGFISQTMADVAEVPFSHGAFFASSPLFIGGARFIGAAGLAGLTLAAAMLLADAFHSWRLRRSLRPFASALIPLICMPALGALAHLTGGSAIGTVRVGVPQVNADRVFYMSQMFNTGLRQSFERALGGLLVQAQPVDLLVTTEEFDNRFLPHFAPLRREWQTYARQTRSAVLLSAPTMGEKARQNATLVIDRDGRLRDIYFKVDLAPFGESTRQAGASHRVVNLKDGSRIGLLICLESALWPAISSHARSADLLVTQTSDVSFGSSPVTFSHLAMSQLRAAEAGRDMVWASNAGPSGLIDRYGNFRQAAPFRETAAARFTATRYDDRALFQAMHIYWLAGAALSLALVLVLGYVRHSRHTESRDPAERRHDSPRRFSTAIGLAAAGCAIPVALLSIPLVEVIHGESRLAFHALAEVLGGPPEPQYDRDPFAFYRSSGGNPTASAVSFYLAEYGLFRRPDDIATPADATRMQAFLVDQFGLPTRTTELDRGLLANVARLTRLFDGSWVVAAQRPPDGDSWSVFLPVSGKQMVMAEGDFQRLQPTSGLVPALQSNLAGAGGK